LENRAGEEVTKTMSKEVERKEYEASNTIILQYDVSVQIAQA